MTADNHIAHYPHGHDRSVLSSHATRTAANSCGYFLDRITPGQRILDIGCGPGSISFDLAELVGVNGYVLGVDFAQDAISTARQASADQGLTNIDFRVGDLYSLPIESGAFDIVHAHQVLQHVSDPIAALRAMASYCKPDGIIVARDADYGGMIWYPESAGMSQWRSIYSESARELGAEPDAGRRLYSWALAAGLEIISATSSTWTYCEEQDRNWWGFSQAERVRNSAFATRAVALGTSEAELEAMAQSWENWANSPDGWFCMPHGEIIALSGRVGGVT